MITASVGVTKYDNVSVREINPLAVSIQMDGRVTYADTNEFSEITFFQWLPDSNTQIRYTLDTDSSDIGQIRFIQEAGGVVDFVTSAADTYSPDVLVPFNISGRHGSTFINGAVDGTALTANTTPVALPDLSATDLKLGFDYNGTIRTFRVWSQDITDAGIEEASA